MEKAEGIVIGVMYATVFIELLILIVQTTYKLIKDKNDVNTIKNIQKMLNEDVSQYDLILDTLNNHNRRLSELESKEENKNGTLS